MNASLTARRLSRAIKGYLDAKEAVIQQGYAGEIDWQDGLDIRNLTESSFLAESAWVVLCCGMRETVVRARFGAVSDAFCNWRSAEAIISRKALCRRQALLVFHHGPKIEAILTIAEHVCRHGFSAVRSRIQEEGVAYLRQFPYMGPATSYHLAKNIGLDVVKPDRHLCRVAAAAGYADPAALCKAISKRVGDKVSVVDLVIWRFATLAADYQEHSC